MLRQEIQTHLVRGLGGDVGAHSKVILKERLAGNLGGEPLDVSAKMNGLVKVLITSESYRADGVNHLQIHGS